MILISKGSTNRPFAAAEHGSEKLGGRRRSLDTWHRHLAALDGRNSS
jgi:hypothetical protein